MRKSLRRLAEKVKGAPNSFRVWRKRRVYRAFHDAYLAEIKKNPEWRSLWGDDAILSEAGSFIQMITPINFPSYAEDIIRGVGPKRLARIVSSTACARVARCTYFLGKKDAIRLFKSLPPIIENETWVMIERALEQKEGIETIIKRVKGK